MNKKLKTIITEILPLVFAFISITFYRRYRYAWRNYYGLDATAIAIAIIFLAAFGASLGLILINKGDTRKQCIFIGAAEIIAAIAVCALVPFNWFSLKLYSSFVLANTEMLIIFGFIYGGANIFSAVNNFVSAGKFADTENNAEDNT